MTSIKDCGVYTPKGFLDQWASNVSVSHHSDQQCPGWVVIGQPAATQVREADAVPCPRRWRPARTVMSITRWSAFMCDVTPVCYPDTSPNEVSDSNFPVSEPV